MKSIPETRAMIRKARPDRVIDLVHELGLVSARDIVDQGIMVEQVGRSHPVYKITIGGTDFIYLKVFGPDRGAMDGIAEVEPIVAEFALDWADLADAMAPVIPLQNAPNLVVTRAVKGRVPLERGSADWPLIVSRAIPRLSGVHRATRPLARPGAIPAKSSLKRALPWALTLFSGDSPPECWSTPAISGVLHAALGYPAIPKGIRRARSMWQPMCLVHCDLKVDNILLTNDEGAIFIDWEMARVGDPCWDLAALVSHLPLIDSDPSGWSDETLAGCRDALVTYSNASRLPLQALSHRIVPYVGAWLLMATIQHRAGGLVDDVDEGAREVFAKAAYTFENGRELAARLAECNS